MCLQLARQCRQLASYLASMHYTSERLRPAKEENQERNLFLKQPKSNRISTNRTRTTGTSIKTNHRISGLNDGCELKFLETAVTTQNFFL